MSHLKTTFKAGDIIQNFDRHIKRVLGRLYSLILCG